MDDAVYLLNFLFQGGPEPKEPFFGTQLGAGCGWDTTIDLFGCRFINNASCEVSP